jgi:hypothetical protein
MFIDSFKYGWYTARDREIRFLESPNVWCGFGRSAGMRGISTMLVLAVATGSIHSACGKSTATPAASQETKPSLQTPQSVGINWDPKWDTAPDKSRKVKPQLVATVGLADDGFRGSPIFEDPAQQKRNAEIRQAFAREFPSVPECSGVSLVTGGGAVADFALQVYSGIYGRAGKLQWILYRTDTLGESAHGEGTGTDAAMSLEAIMQAVCSSIRGNADVKGMVSEVHPASSMSNWKTVSSALETSFAHFHYDVPKGFFALPEDLRLAGNQERFERQVSETLKKGGPDTETHRIVDGNQQAETRITNVFTPYDLVLACSTPPKTIEMTQLPCARVYAVKRLPMAMEARDPAQLVKLVSGVKVLRDSEDVKINGREFVRTDFQFEDGELLSKFVAVNGDYLIQFDFRTRDENDLTQMVKSMRSAAF